MVVISVVCAFLSRMIIEGLTEMKFQLNISEVSKQAMWIFGRENFPDKESQLKRP